MNRPCNEFLSTTCLAGDQNVRIGGRDGLDAIEQFEKFRTAPKDLLEVAPLVEFIFVYFAREFALD